MNFNNRVKRAVVVLVGSTLLALTAGCTSSGDGGNVVVNTPLVYVKRNIAAVGDPLDPVTFAAGGDLLYKALASASAEVINVTAPYTKGKGDVSDPEVSVDAKIVLFSMKGPEDATWNLWEWYLDPLDVPANRTVRLNAGGFGVLARVINDDEIANRGDDIDPYYLPGDRIVFPSTRQKISGVDGKHRDEYERRASTLLHTVDPSSALNIANGSDNAFIDQISFNQSHDRDPIVVSSGTSAGTILFTRWDHVGGNNHFPLFTVNPDGTGMFIKYGAFSSGNSRLHPREFPAGPNEGKIIASLMPLSGTNEGGALVIMDVNNFAEENQPVDSSFTGKGQMLPPPFEGVSFNRTESLLATDSKFRVRLSTPYPLHDGTNRVFLAWGALQLGEPKTDAAGLPVENVLPPKYGIYILDLETKRLDAIAPPPVTGEYVYMDPVALEVRAPIVSGNIDLGSEFDPILDTNNFGQITVKSVYDTDNLLLMGKSALTDAEQAPLIAANAFLDDGRIDITKLVNLPASDRPGRFIRVTKAVPSIQGVGRNVSATDFEMQQIVGYLPVEADGSVRFNITPDMSFAIAVLDSEGRAFQTHLNWIQARRGERRTCNGCHSDRRSTTPLNGGGLLTGLRNVDTSGITETATETIAEVRTNAANDGVRDGMGSAALALAADPDSVDIWSTAGNEENLSIAVGYAGLANPPVNGVINYTVHVQPILTAKCVSCHTGTDANPLTPGPNAGNLILTDTPDPVTGRYLSYAQLMAERAVLNADGSPQTQFNPETGLNEVVTIPSLVAEGDRIGSARNSRLFEVLFGKQLKAGTDIIQANTIAEHSQLTAAEKRLMVEWADIGAQYVNDPSKIQEIMGSLAKLSEGAFLTGGNGNAAINAILIADCSNSGCHQPGSGRSFVLNDNAEGNFNVAANFVNTINPSLSQLLTKAQGTVGAGNQTPHRTIWEAGNANLKIVSDWINAAQ